MAEVNYKKRLNKIMTEQEAVAIFVKDGYSITQSGQYQRTQQSCFREIARQGQKDLTIIDDNLHWQQDMVVGTGQVKKIELCYMPIRQLSGASGMPNIERAMKEGIPRSIELEDYSQFSMGARFVAGAMNVPFFPVKSLLASSYPEYNKRIKVINDPYENKPIALVPAAHPDVAFISVQKADRTGNAQIWGNRASDEFKARAAKHCVIYTEELVSTEVIHKYPAETAIPSYVVDAVVLLPFNCHPWGIYGYYHDDGLALMRDMLAQQTREAFLTWLDEWVLGVKDHYEYCNKIGWLGCNMP